MIDVLVLNYNDADTTKEFVSSIYDFAVVKNIIIVDNHSTDDSFDRLNMGLDKVKLIKTDHNGGYGYGNNYGIKYAAENLGSKRILLCNPDVIVEEETIKAMEQFLISHTDYCVVAPFMLNRNSIKQLNTAFIMPSKWKYILSEEVLFAIKLKAFRYRDIEKWTEDMVQVDGVSGSMFMFDCNKMIAYGMFDEKIFLYGEEWILALKLKSNGCKVALLPGQTFIHNHSVSISKTYRQEWKRRQLMVKSHLYILKNYYKANSFEYIIGWILTRISIVEYMAIGLIKQSKLG